MKRVAGPLLPIDPLLPRLVAALADAPAAVLQAPPGAGKTTRVPPALREAPWCRGRVVMLEPRRLAARAAANRMAALLGEPVGATVGYRIRHEVRVSRQTRIEVVTEGILTRMLQDDPALEGVAAVVFDEFHERSLQADLGLALCLEVQAALRPDLRLIVMSATLDGARVAALLGEVPLLTSPGRLHPVETVYRERAVAGRLEPAVAQAVRLALARHPEGDVLAFLPGQGEIRRTEALLAEALPPRVRLHPLYGNLPPAEQDAALAPPPPGHRKVVLATSIAETSLTIEGVRIVVDGGLARRPRFSPRSGMTRLETRRVSRAAADQRRGRAGREGPGCCYRLWTEAEQAALPSFDVPEIAEADLAPLALELALWGAPDPAALTWLDPPPAAAYAQARGLLHALGTLDAAGQLTDEGRAMGRLGLHPRLAHLVRQGQAGGAGRLACVLAALLEERDVLRGPLLPVDLRLRVDAVASGHRPPSAHGATLDAAALHRVRQHAARLQRRLRASGEAPPEEAGALLALAYPDRLAQRRPGRPGRFLLRNGRGAFVDPADPLAAADFLAVADLDGRAAESRIFLAAPLTLDDVEAAFAAQIEPEEEVAWDAGARAVVARRRERLGALMLKEGPIAHPDPEAVADALVAAVAGEGLALLGWAKEGRGVRERLSFLHSLDPDRWPDASDAALLASLGAWLRPHLYGLRTAADLARLDGDALLRGCLGWADQQALDALAPTHYAVPSGSRLPIDYGRAEAPVLAVRLQEVFGLTDTPRIGGGAVPLTLHLLSPAHRPVQVTRDLASFWAEAYFEVRKDLRGRYPRHYWPENPLEAEPTRRAKPRR